MWTREFDTLTSADRRTVWALWADVNGWTRWNPGLDDVRLGGPFQTGTRFLMTPSGGPTLTSTLVDVNEGSSFTDVTVLGDLSVWVEHRIEAQPGGQLRLVYRAQVEGPDEEAAGEAITGDFPEVLAALVEMAVRTEREALAA
jgi:hypothetical protein